ncbi:neural cell adhesion molecule 1, partial [Musca vetustissima]|uniref:neural cell adhesion molecule 1 n=1 Tax=Musca vetustissima TaxID=27455 RepID=UPI002AB6057B
YYEDYYDDLESSSGGPEPLIELETVFVDPPYFERAEIEISAQPNADVLMNCDVKNFHANNVVIWYKDQTVIINGQHSMNDRFEALKNNSIVLRNAQPDDEGNYFCTVLPQNITQNVVLTIEKAFTIRCDGRDVLDRSIVYRQGESHVCECKASGEESNIKWFLNNRRSSDVELEVDENAIYIDPVDEHHAGIYQCIDDDGSATPKHGRFEVVVHYAPKVSTHRHHVNTDIGSTAELYCDYRSYPIAVTRWLKNNQYLSLSEKYMMTYAAEQHFNRSTLTVRDVTTDDLGEYKCQAENSIGSSELKVHLMLEPERGQFESVEIKGNVVTLYWLVRSLQPLSEAVLDYKMTGAYTWSTTSVLHTHRHEDGIWKITHEMELLPGEWQTRMKTKNTMGWSKFSAPYIFTIREESEDDNVLDIVDDKENVVIAGFGGGAKEQKSSAASRSCHLSLYVLLLLVTTTFYRQRHVGLRH